ncbi:MAG: hypothetical protein H6741_18710 [Alphaproteobacteria bacterium]|nr:hypothetical protein [Alphaproteobacteria bacterium]MCB9794742.1 hypothetical protein [Alphaproteobacteria bacterium]
MQYRLNQGPPAPRYEDAPGPALQAVREALLRDQGWLCAYCMKRIRQEKLKRAAGAEERDTRLNMKVEHWFPRHPDTEDPVEAAMGQALQLSWGNLLGCCKGGEGRPAHLHHCDTAKKSHIIRLKPTDKPEQLVYYGVDGELLSDDDAVQHELDEVLRLNLDHLRLARRAALEAYKQGVHQRHKGTWSPQLLQRELLRLEDPHQTHLESFLGIITAYLRRRL